MDRKIEEQQRAAVVEESRTWLRTPFVHNARIKGAGADCETFLCEVFARAGIFTALDIPYQPAQWFLHTREELYLKYLSQYASEYSFVQAPGATPPQPGDIICVKSKYIHSHGAIVIAWPLVIHCFPPHVMESNVFYNPIFAGRELKFFNPWIAPKAVQP